MAHTIICGITMSGKTTICQIYANELVKAGKNVAVVDPYASQKWGNVKFVDTAEELVAFLRENKSYYFFIDESSMMLDRYDTTLYWLATNSRHYGHSGFFICQRVQQIHPNIRQQCVKAVIFKTAKSDSKTLGEDYAAEIVEEAASLKQFEFIKVSGFGEHIKGRVDVVKRKIESRT